MLPGDLKAYDQAQRDRFVALGVDETRRMLMEGKLGERKGRLAAAWLSERDALTAGEEREIDRGIARKAIARATWANVVAVLALIVAIASAAADWLK